METLMKIIVRTFFMFYGDKLKGDRTALVGVLTGILALWTMIQGEGLFQALCDLAAKIPFFSKFCDIESTVYYSIMLALVAGVTTALKYLDTNEMGKQRMMSSGYTEGNFARLEIYAIAAALIVVAAVVVGIWKMGFAALLFGLIPIWLLTNILGAIKAATK